MTCSASSNGLFAYTARQPLPYGSVQAIGQRNNPGTPTVRCRTKTPVQHLFDGELWAESLKEWWSHHRYLSGRRVWVYYGNGAARS